MRIGKHRSISQSRQNTTITHVIAKLNDPTLATRVQLAARNAALAQLRSEGIELTPEQWGELACTLMSKKRDPGDVLAGAAAVVIGISISDARCKRDVVRIGTLPCGVGLYEYSHTGFTTRWRGVIAQDVVAKRPDAVIADPSGYLVVNYAQLGISPEVA